MKRNRAPVRSEPGLACPRCGRGRLWETRERVARTTVDPDSILPPKRRTEALLACDECRARFVESEAAAAFQGTFWEPEGDVLASLPAEVQKAARYRRRATKRRAAERAAKASGRDAEDMA